LTKAREMPSLISTDELKKTSVLSTNCSERDLR